MRSDLTFPIRVVMVVGIFLALGWLLLPDTTPELPHSSGTSAAKETVATPRFATGSSSLPTHTSAIQRADQPALAPPPPDNPASGPPHPDAVAFGSSAFTPERETQILMGFLEIYRERFGQFPAAEDNAQMMNALRGSNPDRLAIFPSVHPRLDADGALLDAWGHPFILHQIGQDRIEVRSAGADGAWHTDDDLIAPRRPGVPDP